MSKGRSLKRTISQDDRFLGTTTVTQTKDDGTGTESSGKGAASGCFQREEHGRDQEDTTDSREKAHGDIWDTRLEVVLSDLLEVEVAIESSEPAEQSNEKLREWGMNVHEEFALDVFGREATEAVMETTSAIDCITDGVGMEHRGFDILDLVEHYTGGLVDTKQAHQGTQNRQSK